MINRYICKAKRVDNGEWVEGDLIQWKNGNMQICLGVGLSKEQKSLVDIIPETVGQCSEVPDKNGKLMYEGDIIDALFDFGMPIKSVCVFRDGSFGLLARQHGAEHFHPFTSLCNITYKIVGNKFDNPELLEAESNDN